MANKKPRDGEGNFGQRVRKPNILLGWGVVMVKENTLRKEKEEKEKFRFVE